MDNTHTNIIKNFFKLLVAAVALVAFVGCENTEPGKKDNRLKTPVVNCNVQENTIIATWESIDFAISYTVALNDGEAVSVEDTVYRFEQLDYDTEYTITVTAISADPATRPNSDPAVAKAKTAVRVVPQYREWYSVAPALAVSNNGRWAVGGFDKNGVIIDLSNDRLEAITNMEFNDVADDGTAVGVYFVAADDGGSAMYYKNGEHFLVDLSNVVSELYCSALVGITPDGKFAVGWFYDYDENNYFVQQFGLVVPFAYDIEKNRVTVLQPDYMYGQYRAATQTTAVSPDRRIVGFEQSSLGMLGVMWADEASPWEYICMNGDSDNAPTEAFGGEGTTLLSPRGRYVFGNAATYNEKHENAKGAAAYDLEKKQLMWFPTFATGSVTAMTDDGIAFLNDVPYGYGTTSFVIDTNEDLNASMTLVEWLKEKHNMDLSANIQDGIIIIGTSEDGRTLVGMTSTMSGYLTFAVSLDGEAMN